MATCASLRGFKGGLGSSFYESWESSLVGEDCIMSDKTQVRDGKATLGSHTMMKNVNEGKGIFAPAVVVK